MHFKHIQGRRVASIASCTSCNSISFHIAYSDYESSQLCDHAERYSLGNIIQDNKTCLCM